MPIKKGDNVNNTGKKYSKDMTLNRQERFAQEYVRTLNATKSAIAAGYSEKSAHSTGCTLLKTPKVLARVRELQQELLAQLPVSVYWVLKQYIEVYERCMQQEPVMKWDYEEKKFVHNGEWQFDSKGALNALDSMGKYLNMFGVKSDINGNSLEKLDKILGAFEKDADK